MSDYQHILVERFGAVERILHNRPEKRNAENKQTLIELEQAFRAAEADAEVKVVILGGTGDHFSAGHDLKEGERKRPNMNVETRWAYELKHFYDFCLVLHDMRKPTIAQVQGACIAGAFMLANVCDLMVAADDAFFADPVVQSLGVAAGELLVHPWVMGMRKAKEILYTGRRFSAAEGHEIGMINKVVPRAELEASTMEMAQQIAKGPAFALEMMKRSLNRTLDAQGFRVALNAHFDGHQLTHYSEHFLQLYAGGLSQGIGNAKALEG